jgi:hypothetical protein
VFAATEESQSVRSHCKARVGEATQQLPVMGIKQNIEDLLAFFTDKMLVLGH